MSQVHVVKQPFLFDIVWKMFKPFVREKLRGRMFFHGSKMNSLHQYLAPSHLPANYGGQLPEINYTAADWFPTILKCEDSIKSKSNFCKNKLISNQNENDNFVNRLFRRMEFIWLQEKRIE